MIDFLKILITDKTLINQINANPLLIWHDKKERLSHFDFESILSKETKVYKGILFCFYDNKVEVLFRPHYYFNENLHNANDFSIANCITVITNFLEQLSLSGRSELLKVINVEYGVNIISPIDCKELVTFISYHGKNEFRTDAGLPYSKKSYSETSSGAANKYKIIKAYNKGIHYPKYCDINTFRFEVKSKQTKYIKKIGIDTISDLLNREVYKNLSIELLNEFDEVMILGSAKEYSELSKKENNQLNKYLNPNNWYKLKQGHRNNFTNTKKRYFHLLDKTQNNIHKTIKKLIENKLQELEQTCAISTPVSKEQTCAYSTINIYGNCTYLPHQKCIVTGLDISMQKEGSFLLSHKGLKYYFESDKKTFDEVKQKYLSMKWENANIDVQIKEIAHNIRNKVNNSRIKQGRIYRSEQINLLAIL